MNTSIRNLALGAIATAAIATTALTPLSAYATESTDQVVAATKADKADPNLQLSQDGYNVMRDVRAARIAIFNGDTEAATKYVDQAKQDVAKAKTDDGAMKTADTGDKNLIAIDGQLVVSDNFDVTPEKAQHIAAGNEHIKNGDGKAAIEELKLADVDVGFTRVLMPLAETQTHVNLASEQIGKGNYYEANMALKAAEDGLNVETVMLIEVPKTDQGKTGSVQKTTDPEQPPAKSN